MKRLVLIVLAAGAAAAMTAQAWAAPPPAWASLASRETRTIARIDQAVKVNQISAAEAGRLQRQLHRVQSLQAYYRKSHGMSAWERRDLERRLKTIDAHIGKRHEARPAKAARTKA